MCVHMTAGTYRDEKRVLDSLELELQGIELLTWVLGSELGSSGRTVHVLNCESPL